MPILNHREGGPLTRDVGTRLPMENVSVVCSIRARHVVGMLGARKTDGILLKASRILNDAIERPESKTAEARKARIGVLNHHRRTSQHACFAL